MRWIVGLGGLLVAGIALWLLTSGGAGEDPRTAGPPPLDDIDAKSRAAMRELLREQGE